LAGSGLAGFNLVVSNCVVNLSLDNTPPTSHPNAGKRQTTGLTPSTCPTTIQLLKISTTRSPMSTVNFSVPEAVKQAFNEAFQGQNKSAIIADLMLEAVERAQASQRSQTACQRILARREHAPSISEDAFRAAREADRE
jgi:hypothetical protein